MESKKCGKCGAHWLNGQLFWSTGKQGNDADLAGLVCDRWGDDQCINPSKGDSQHGDTWAKRLAELDRFEELSDR